MIVTVLDYSVGKVFMITDVPEGICKDSNKIEEWLEDSYYGFSLDEIYYMISDDVEDPAKMVVVDSYEDSNM